MDPFQGNLRIPLKEPSESGTLIIPLKEPSESVMDPFKGTLLIPSTTGSPKGALDMESAAQKLQSLDGAQDGNVKKGASRIRVTRIGFFKGSIRDL